MNQAQMREEFEEWAADYAGILEELLSDNVETEPDDFLVSMRQLIAQRRTLAPSMLAEVQRTLAARRAARAARAGSEPPGTIPLGRQQVTGTVELVHRERGDAQRGMRLVITVNTGMFRVRGTCPAAVRVRYTENTSRQIQRGDRIRFIATLQPSGHTSGLGYFTNPRGAAYVTA